MRTMSTMSWKVVAMFLYDNKIKTDLHGAHSYHSYHSFSVHKRPLKPQLLTRIRLIVIIVLIALILPHNYTDESRITGSLYRDFL